MPDLAEQNTSPYSVLEGVPAYDGLAEVLDAFNVGPDYQPRDYGHGLINTTVVLSLPGESPAFVLQRINTNVFPNPTILDRNLTAVVEAIIARNPAYILPAAVRSSYGSTMIQTGSGFWRMFEFIPHSKSQIFADSPERAEEAACQFGVFGRLLEYVSADKITPSIPHFHDLNMRINAFERSVETGNVKRVSEQFEAIASLRNHFHIASRFAQEVKQGRLPVRLMHHDTKISNVLFHSHTAAGICVIDLDTVMPGTIVSDVGDMMRTYLCPVDENHVKLESICIRQDYYRAVLRGYLRGFTAHLKPSEIELIPFAGKYMILMQAVRFMTDYFDNDRYYGCRYEHHNRDRALNQLCLLEKYCEFVDRGAHG